MSDNNATKEESTISVAEVEEAIDEVDRSISNESDGPIKYSEEELEMMRSVQRKLKEEDGLEYVNPRFLAFTLIVSKNRVDEAVKKYRQLLKAIRPCDMNLVEEDEVLWNDSGVPKFLADYYVPCGLDNQGHQIMWIKSDKPTTKDEEKTFVRASILFVVAVHAHDKSLREGITFVIDTSVRPEPVGNESKLQKVRQSFPLRPQAIYLAGASAATRVLINGLIRIAALFTKQKILQRIKFVTLKEAIEKVPKESGPKYLGGNGGGIEDIVAWTRERYDSFPIPQL